MKGSSDPDIIYFCSSNENRGLNKKLETTSSMRMRKEYIIKIQTSSQLSQVWNILNLEQRPEFKRSFRPHGVSSSTMILMHNITFS